MGWVLPYCEVWCLVNEKLMNDQFHLWSTGAVFISLVISQTLLLTWEMLRAIFESCKISGSYAT